MADSKIYMYDLDFQGQPIRSDTEFSFSDVPFLKMLKAILSSSIIFATKDKKDHTKVVGQNSLGGGGLN